MRGARPREGMLIDQHGQSTGLIIRELLAYQGAPVRCARSWLIGGCALAVVTELLAGGLLAATSIQPATCADGRSTA